MATITTTTNATPFIYPSQTQIERGTDVLGTLYVLVAATAANTFELWRSTNAGASWTLALSTVRANVVEDGGIQVLRNPYNQMVWVYRTYESGQDRVYIRTISDLSAPTLAWNPELQITAVTAASAGTVLTGVDLANVTVSGQYHYAIIAVGTQSGALHGVKLYVAYGSTLASLAVNSTLIAGTREWYITGSGRITPSIDVEHTGDGHSGSAPHLWVAWGRTNVYSVKLSWTGNGWSGPTSPVKLNPTTLTPAQDSIAARWDGQRHVTVVPDPVATSTVTVLERNRSNSTTTIRATPTHPTGVVRNCSLGYNSVTGDLRVFAVGTSTTVLHYVDFIRATGLWSSWVAVVATAVLGATGNNYSIRRATNGRYDVVTAHATPTPNTVLYTPLSLSYAPNAPVWDPGAMRLQSGTAADVAAPLTLAWVFSDPDPADTQSAYAISRQIGAGALAYWRASDSTWQAAEVQNPSATAAITLAAGWQSATDATTAYRVKVWDSASVPSVYSDAFVIVPSAKVAPTISSPTAGATLTADSVTVAWTVSEQSAYRLLLDPNPAHLNSNPFFEVDATGWTPFGGTFVRSTAQFHTGVAAGLLTPDGVTGTAQVVTQPPVNVSAGVVYRGSAWVRCAVARQIRMAFDWITSTLNVYFTVAANTWTLIEYNAPAPAGASQLQWWIAMDGTPPAGNLLYVDEAGVKGPARYDSGWVGSSDARSQAAPTTLADLTAWTVSLQTRNAEGLASDSVAVSFTIDYVEPPAATPAATPAPASGVITVVAMNPAAVGAQPAVTDQDLYARPNVAGANLLTNPGFEVNTTGWQARGGATITRSTAQFHSGVAAALITPDGVGTPSRIECVGTQMALVQEGQSWTVDGWLRPTTANKPIEFGVNWTDIADAFVTSSTVQVAPIAGAWLYLQATFAVPIGLSVAKVGLRAGVANTPAVGDTLHVDDLRLRPADATTGTRVAAGLLSGATYPDWRAVSGVDYEYRLLTRATNGTSMYGPWTA